MKVIFLNIDGVLNTDNVMYTDESLSSTCIEHLADLVKATDAKIVLSSNWRYSLRSLCLIIEALSEHGLSLYSLTSDGAPKAAFKNTPWENIKPCSRVRKHKLKNYDRGAEIAFWLIKHPVDQFVILDDESVDIKNYFPDNLVKTWFRDGLTAQDVIKAKEILEREQGN